MLSMLVQEVLVGTGCIWRDPTELRVGIEAYQVMGGGHESPLSVARHKHMSVDATNVMPPYKEKY